jgi:endonuclease/exonuclease/phosphatase family metal-dependent hydrolase
VIFLRPDAYIYGMRYLILLCIFFISRVVIPAQVKMCAWNLENFGRSKTDSVMMVITATLRQFDLVCVSEVVAGNGGAQAVARLADALNRTGAKWDYTISDPTSGTNGIERYAFLWKTHVLQKKGDAWLDQVYQQEIEREPFFAAYAYGEKEFIVAVFHAVPKSKNPESEIKYLKWIDTLYKGKTVLYCGDFNCPQSNNVFNPLRARGYLPALVNQKTTLKQKPVGEECLASEFDNIFYRPSQVAFISSGVVPFYRDFPNLQKARRVSDHLPVYLEFQPK